MIRQNLAIHGGGVLEIHGDWPARRVLLILCRDDFRKDDPLMSEVIGYFTKRKHTVLKYETQITVTARLIDQRCFWGCPSLVRRGLKFLLLLFFPTRWRYFSSRYRARCQSMDYRRQSLRELFRWLGPEKELCLLARSASARVASVMADEAGIKKLVCLGYPFEHPDRGPEPARYGHLLAVQTPMLIIQGRRDIYGGAEILEKYQYAPNTVVHLIEADHGLTMPKNEMTRFLKLIEEFVFQAEQPNGAVAESTRSSAIASA